MPVDAEVSGVIPGLRDSRTGGVEGEALRKQTNPAKLFTFGVRYGSDQGD